VHYALHSFPGEIIKIRKGEILMKRAISLFLSMVMLLSITAGLDFSAYAEECQPNMSSFDEFVDNGLQDFIKLDKVKNYFKEKYNVEITDTTTVPDLMVSISPTLLCNLQNSANVAEIRGTTASIADIFYAYLDDEDSAIDFYTLYTFCVDNKNSSNKELATYCKDTYNKLEELLGAYEKANNDFTDAFETSIEYVDETYSPYVEEQCVEFTPEEIRQVDVDGTPLCDIKDEKADAFVNCINGMFDCTNKEIEVTNIADALYYEYQYDSFTNVISKSLAKLGGATVAEDTHFTGDFSDEYYYEITKGVLIYSGLFTSEEIDAMALTENQLEQYADYASQVEDFNYKKFIFYSCSKLYKRIGNL
jgi:tetratricopeptide (TPR) repeat protein